MINVLFNIMNLMKEGIYHGDPHRIHLDPTLYASKPIDKETDGELKGFISAIYEKPTSCIVCFYEVCSCKRG